MIALIDGDLDFGHCWFDVQGYVKTSIGNQKESLVHRLVAENALGRKLKSTEHVHHINGIKYDNRRSNLLICSNSYHQLLHARQDVQNDGYNPNTHQYCSSCQVYHPLDLFPKNKNRWSGVHNMCKKSTNAARRGKRYGKFTWKERLLQQYRRVFKQYTKRDICSIPKEGRCL